MLGCAVLGIVACAEGEEGGDRPVARAYDQVLLWSDLRQVIPIEATPVDSTAMAEQYIEAWVKQQVVLHVAEQNQAGTGLGMEDQLEDYRRSLVIYNYEQALVDQKLDTAVSQAQIEEYYERNRANFELKEPSVRLRWFKVNEADKRVLRKQEERFLRGGDEDRHELELWLAQRGITIVDRSGIWSQASVVSSEMALEAALPDDLFLRDGRRVMKGEHGACFIEVLEHRPPNSTSPLEVVRADIRAILLNQRKLQLIEDMRASIYAQALENDHVERYAP